ncbi:hypothetical protein ACJRO7_017159 [Eucalyptus globulus]|uniref:Uncharacterized protein n=1 Tax=Eucalyptus globulus TaxID=34317 RepID=A0ABD3KP94_EUCGL
MPQRISDSNDAIYSGAQLQSQDPYSFFAELFHSIILELPRLSPKSGLFRLSKISLNGAFSVLLCKSDQSARSTHGPFNSPSLASIVIANASMASSD